MVQAIRGMRDVLPEQARQWHYVESRIREVLLSHAYEEIQLPLLEATELFSRGVGEATDIVEKEMYSLEARDGESLTLRPEGTAGCVRALQQHGLLFNQTQRVFYSGPMFRYERPQKGRYRQFYQIGAEALGFAGPDVDAELILLGRDFWRALGVEKQVELEINTLGSSNTRAAYTEALVDYLTPLKGDMDEVSQRRLERNPLRILDSKTPATQALLNEAPKLPEFIDAESKAHYGELKSMLTALEIPYRENPGLVRGLDYYTHSVFEWITASLGAQGTVCAGGRYDGLVERLGGRRTPAAGFGLGLDRVVLLHEEVCLTSTNDVPGEFSAGADVYVCVMTPALASRAMNIADQLRLELPGLRIRYHAGGGKLKNQLKRADLCGAGWAILVGEDEVQKNQISVKFLRDETEQQLMSLDALIALLRKRATNTAAGSGDS